MSYLRPDRLAKAHSTLILAGAPGNRLIVRRVATAPRVPPPSSRVVSDPIPERTFTSSFLDPSPNIKQNTRLSTRHKPHNLNTKIKTKTKHRESIMARAPPMPTIE